MATVQGLLGNRKVVGDLGIEIETETARAYEIRPIEGWKSVSDGSLRNFGREYVTNGPVKRDALAQSLKTWKEGLGPVYANLDRNSISTSVHVHVNVQDLTPLQVLNHYLCGILFENVMAKFAGPDRIGNLFCLRTIDAEDQYNAIKQSMKRAQNEIDVLMGFNPNGYKYSNINTIPVTGFGSIEFRVMRGTVDTDEIRVWAEVLHDIREFSKRYDNPVSIIKAMKELGADGLLKEAFGANADVFKYPNWERDLLCNFIYVADMATCRRDWVLKESVPEERKLKVKAPQVGIDWDAMRRAQNVPAPQPQPIAQPIQWDEDFEEEDM